MEEFCLPHVDAARVERPGAVVAHQECPPQPTFPAVVVILARSDFELMVPSFAELLGLTHLPAEKLVELIFAFIYRFAIYFVYIIVFIFVDCLVGLRICVSLGGQKCILLWLFLR